MFDSFPNWRKENRTAPLASITITANDNANNSKPFKREEKKNFYYYATPPGTDRIVFETVNLLKIAKGRLAI